jgi:hypothetical protein
MADLNRKYSREGERVCVCVQRRESSREIIKRQRGEERERDFFLVFTLLPRCCELTYDYNITSEADAGDVAVLLRVSWEKEQLQNRQLQKE